ncbi:hypothetical protein BDV37DRAFT_263868, partial [Aspergillus pseudonomiae]
MVVHLTRFLFHGARALSWSRNLTRLSPHLWIGYTTIVLARTQPLIFIKPGQFPISRIERANRRKQEKAETKAMVGLG